MVNSYGTKSVDMLLYRDYCKSVDIKAGGVVPVGFSFKEGKVVMTSNTVFFIYFEYDGVEYQARIDTSKSGINKCVSVTPV